MERDDPLRTVLVKDVATGGSGTLRRRDRQMIGESIGSTDQIGRVSLHRLGVGPYGTTREVWSEREWDRRPELTSRRLPERAQSLPPMR